jgi:GAF domain-containing protein
MRDYERVTASLDREQTVQGLLHTTCRELVELLDGTACAISRVVGDLLVGLEEFTRTRRPLEHGHEFLISDFPLTQEVVERGEPRRLSRRDPDADAKEAELLEQLGFESLLMVCLPAGGLCWGLVEVYGEGGSFDEYRAELAERVAAHAGDRLEELERRRSS